MIVDATLKSSDAHPVSPADVGSDDFMPGLNAMGASFVLPSDEHFFGFGERYVTVDHRGTSYEVYTEEGGLGRGEATPPSFVPPYNPTPNGPTMTHAPIPFVMSNKGYGLWLESTYRTGFHLGSDAPGAWRMYAVEPHLRYHVLVHALPADTLTHYTQLTGRASLPAPGCSGRGGASITARWPWASPRSRRCAPTRCRPRRSTTRRTFCPTARRWGKRAC